MKLTKDEAIKITRRNYYNNQRRKLSESARAFSHRYADDYLQQWRSPEELDAFYKDVENQQRMASALRDYYKETNNSEYDNINKFAEGYSSLLADRKAVSNLYGGFDTADDYRRMLDILAIRDDADFDTLKEYDKSKDGYYKNLISFGELLGYNRDTPHISANEAIWTSLLEYNVEAMTPEERENTVAILNKYGEDAATEYLERLDPVLAQRDAEKFYAIGQKHPLLSSVVSVPTNVLSAIEQPISMIDGSYNKFSNITTSLRGGVSSDMSGFESFLYNTGMSGADSIVAGLMPGYMGEVMLGLSAAASTQNDILRRGGTQGQAVLGGVAAGIAEAAFEHIPLDKLRKMSAKNIRTTFKAFLGNLAENIGTNALEEMGTEITNILSDAIIMGELSNINLTIDKYVASGMSEEKAYLKAFVDFGIQVAEAGASGAVMGGFLGGAGAAISTAGNYFTGNSIVKDQQRYDKLIEIGDMLSQDVDNKKTAEARELFSAIKNYQPSSNNGTAVGKISGKLKDMGHKADVGTFVNMLNTKDVQVSFKTLSEKSKANIPQTVTTAENAAKTANVSTADADIRKSNAPKIVSAEGQELSKIFVEKDGQAVSLDKLSIEDSDLAMAYSYAVTTGSVESANEFISAYTLSGDNTAPTAFWSSWMGIMASGQTLSTTDENMQKVFAEYGDTLSDSAKLSAWLSGVTSKQKASERRIKAAEQARELWEKDGRKVTRGSIDASALHGVDLDSKQREFVAFGRLFAESIGMNVKFVASKKGDRGDNGSYNRKTNTITLDVFAGIGNDANYNAVQSALANTLSHEVVHNMRIVAPKEYDALSDYVFDTLKAQGVDIEERIQYQIAQSKDKKLSREDAIEEIVAHACDGMLKTSETVREFMEGFYAKDRRAARRFEQKVREIIKRLKEVFDTLLGTKAYSEEARTLYKAGSDRVAEIQKLFDKGVLAMREGNLARNYEVANKGSNTQTEKTSEVKQARESVTIDLTDDTDLAKMVEGIHGSPRYKAIANYILNTLGSEPITLSDGKQAIVDKRDASHIASNAGNDKTRYIAKIKDLVSQAELYAYDNNAEHNKFNQFLYYKATVRYENESFPLYLNVGRGLNDNRYHLYDITKTIRDTANRINGFERPKPNEGYALENDISKDIISQPETIVNRNGEKFSEETVNIDNDSESVAPEMFSRRTWTESEYVVHRDQMAEKIASALGVSVSKAKSYIDDINSIAKMIADDRARLDYEASSFGSAFVSNVEYGGSFDYTTLCKKRRIYTGTFTEIQKRLKNTALTPDDILKIRNMMIEEGIEATCGLCYVEGSRANMGKFAKEFIRLYKRDNAGAWIPNMADVNTPDGVEQMRINHPEAYEQYVYFWNHYGKLKDSDPALFASQQKPKLYEARKEYKGEIIEFFTKDTTVDKKNRNGGIRMQSFSDFEIVHLIDTMQVIMDMSTVGLAGQAYTKVPEFAKAFGNTGLKINLSLIAKGVDANGKLIFDDREGMPHKTAFELRDQYSANVGTIIVTFTDEQLYAAMADPRIDFIIPFHRSQWKKGQYGAMGLPKGTKDYTFMQNEKLIKKTYHEYRGRMVADKATNYMPNEYWDFTKSGKENAEMYLQMCAENNKRPKFYKLLDFDGKGTYSLRKDGSTDGYWKLLIDFKMYDNDGIGSPQKAVMPEFNMEEATNMLAEYEGGHSKYPVASGVVDRFVEEYNGGAADVMGQARANTVDGRIVAVIEDDILSGIYSGQWDKNTAERAKKAAKTALFKFKDGIAVKGITAKVNRDSRREYTRSNYSEALRNHDPDTYADKLRAASVADDVVIAATNWKRDGGLTKPRKDDFVDFDRGQTLIMSGTNKYSATVLVGITKQGDYVFYDVEDMSPTQFEIKNEGDLPTVTPDKPFDDILKVSNGNSIPQSQQKSSGFDENSSDELSQQRIETPDPSTLLKDVIRNKIGAKEYGKYTESLKKYQDLDTRAKNQEKRISEIDAKIKKLKHERNQSGKGTRMDELYRMRKTAEEKVTEYRNRMFAMEAGELSNVVKQETEKARQTVQREARERYHKSVVSRHNTERRNRLRKIVNELNTLFAKGNKKKNVKSGLSDTVEKALKLSQVLVYADIGNEEVILAGLMTSQTDAEQKVIDKYKAAIEEKERLDAELDELREQEGSDNEAKVKELRNKINKLNAEKREYANTLRDLLEREKRILSKMKIGSIVDELAKAYSDLQNAEESFIRQAYSEVTENRIKKLAEDLETVYLKDMTENQLDEIVEVYKAVLKTVKEANKAFISEKGETYTMLAENTKAEIMQRGKAKDKENLLSPHARKFMLSNAIPVWFFDNLRSNTLIRLFTNLANAEDDWAVLIKDAQQYKKDVDEKYDVKKWDFDKTFSFTLRSGKKVDVTLSQLFSLYAYAKQGDEAKNHLFNGGFVYAKSIILQDATKKHKKYIVRQGSTFRLDETVLAEMFATMEKAAPGASKYIDEMVAYLSGDLAQKGNDTAEKLYGIRLFNKSYYFPITSSADFIRSKEQKSTGQSPRLKNWGATNERVTGANNPIVLDSFEDIWAKHVSQMASFASFTLPLEDMERVITYSTRADDKNDAESVKGIISTILGREYVEYIDRLIDDLNGGARADDVTGYMNTFMGLAKTGATAMSMSTLVQQPTSMFRAMAFIDPKYFALSRAKLRGHKEEWAELQKYAPVAIIKEMGGYDTGLGAKTAQYLKSPEYDTFGEKAVALIKDSSYRNEVIFKAPAVADEITWCYIWAAVKKEVAATNKALQVDSEAYYKACGERFEYVIRRTQVYDSVLARSPLMRSKNPAAKMVTSFASEPTVFINMGYGAVDAVQRKEFKKATRILVSSLASIITNAIVSSFVYAARDDDEDETYIEKYIQSFNTEMIEGLNPITYIPFLRDIWSIMLGYDIERLDVSVIVDVWHAFEGIFSSRKSPLEKIATFLGKLSTIFGVPLNNLIREGRATINLFRLMVEYFENGELADVEGILEALQESGKDSIPLLDKFI